MSQGRFRISRMPILPSVRVRRPPPRRRRSKCREITLPVPSDKRLPLTFRDWVGVFCTLAVPLVNPVVPFFWAFGHTRDHLKPFARAVLVYEALVLVAVLVYLAVAGGAP